MNTTASSGSVTAARFFSSRRHLDRPLPEPVRVLPRAADFVLARIPLALCTDPWPVIQSRARVDLANLNREAGK